MLSKALTQSAPKRILPQLRSSDWTRLKSVSEIILVAVAITGTVAVAAIAPNLFKIIPIFYKRKGYKHRFTDKEIRYNIEKGFYYLKKSGRIRMKMTKGELAFRLTSLGKKKIDSLNFHRLSIPRPKHWNGYWWEVAADIPTKNYKAAADMLRWKLKEMKFYPLQRTLWFYPHDPRKELDFIVHHYGVEKFVTVMEVNRLDKSDERLLKTYFRKYDII